MCRSTAACSSSICLSHAFLHVSLTEGFPQVLPRPLRDRPAGRRYGGRGRAGGRGRGGAAPGRVATERDMPDLDPATTRPTGGPAMRAAQCANDPRPRLATRPLLRLAPTPPTESRRRGQRLRRGPRLDRPLRGVSGYIGDGSNRWPAVHRLDSARLFRLAVENAPAGSALHAVADEGVPIRTLLEVIGRHLDIPLASISADDAGEHFTWLAGFLGLDSPASSALTRKLLGWLPPARAHRRPRPGPLLCARDGQGSLILVRTRSERRPPGSRPGILRWVDPLEDGIQRHGWVPLLDLSEHHSAGQLARVQRRLGRCPAMGR